MRRTALLIVGVALLALLDTAWAKSSSVATFNTSLFWSIHSFRLALPGLYELFTTLTLIGTNYVLAPIGLLLAAWSFRKGRGEEAVGLLVCAILAPVATELLKAAISSPRPHLIPFPTLLRPRSDHGFPSGHALFSMVIFGWGAVLASRHMKRFWGRTAVVTACVAFILGIGLSRLYLGVHWPNDVIGGYLYGLLLLLATTQYKKTHHRDAEHTES